MRTWGLSTPNGRPGKSSLQPVAPIVRPAMQVRDRKHQDVAVVDGIDQPIREPTEPAAFAQRMPRLRQARDSVRGSQHLNQKRMAQPTRRLPRRREPQYAACAAVSGKPQGAIRPLAHVANAFPQLPQQALFLAHLIAVELDAHEHLTRKGTDE